MAAWLAEDNPSRAKRLVAKLDIEDLGILMLANDYKMPESEVRERFTDYEISRIFMLNAAKNEEQKIRHPELFNK